MLVGVISDTHSLMRADALKALGGVELILHAGDVGGPVVLAALARIAPVHAVLGNTDIDDGTLPAHVRLTLDGVSVDVTHGHELGSPTPDSLLARYDADVIVYGHTHQPLIERRGTRLVVNPGAAGPRRFSVQPTIALLRVDGGRAEAEVIHLADRAAR